MAKPAEKKELAQGVPGLDRKQPSPSIPQVREFTIYRAGFEPIVFSNVINAEIQAGRYLSISSLSISQETGALVSNTAKFDTKAIEGYVEQRLLPAQNNSVTKPHTSAGERNHQHNPFPPK